jgi:hypothetical protein
MRRHLRVVLTTISTVILSQGCVDRGSEPPPPPEVPAITVVFPETLRVSEPVQILGTGFGEYSSLSAVVFAPDNTPSIYLSWTDGEIRCIVPPGVVSGEMYVRKGELRSGGMNVSVVGVQTLVLSRTSVILAAGESTVVTVTGGTLPYSIQTNSSASVATATLSGSILTITGVAQGETVVSVVDASSPFPLTAGLSVQVAVQQSSVSFSQQIVPIFNASCVSCHGGRGDLFLTSSQAYSNLVNVSTRTGSCFGMMRVLPGNSAQSSLFRRVAGTCSDRMPLGGSLTQSEIELIRQWIDQGALNN